VAGRAVGNAKSRANGQRITSVDARLSMVGAFKCHVSSSLGYHCQIHPPAETNALGGFWLDADIEEIAFAERGRVNEAPPDASEPHSVKIAADLAATAAALTCGGQCALGGT
jgi:hypothetical protein